MSKFPKKKLSATERATLKKTTQNRGDLKTFCEKAQVSRNSVYKAIAGQEIAEYTANDIINSL
jgi:hypothetical protein